MKNVDELLKEASNSIDVKQIDSDVILEKAKFRTQNSRTSKLKPKLGIISFAAAACVVAGIVLPISLMNKSKENSDDDIHNQPSESPSYEPTIYEPLVEDTSDISSESPVNLAHKLQERNEINTIKIVNESEIKNVVDKINTFSSSLFARINNNLSSKRNSAYSPASTYFALSMLGKITQNQNKAEILSALGISEDELNTILPKVIEACCREYNTGKERVDNSIWLDDAFNYKQSTLEDLAKTCFANTFEGSFANDNKNLNRYISAYVNDCTEGLLKPVFNFPTSTSFVVLSSLFFEDSWLAMKDPLDLIESGDFKQFDGTTKNINYYGFTNEKYFSDGRVKSTAYYDCMYIKTNSDFKITFIVPKEGVAVDNVFTPEILDEVNSVQYDTVLNEKRYKTQVIIPEFSASFDGNITKDLFSTLGISSINDFGDFAIKKDGSKAELNIGEIHHTTKLLVTKDYIKGAAAASNGASGIIPSPDVVETFKIDRPFAYTIKDKYGIELFEGVIYNV